MDKRQRHIETLVQTLAGALATALEDETIGGAPIGFALMIFADDPPGTRAGPGGFSALASNAQRQHVADVMRGALARIDARAAAEH